MRLDKFLSQQLAMSRNWVSKELRAGKVTVNGVLNKDSAYKLDEADVVAYEGQELKQVFGPRYFMLHKPEGYVCSTDDPVNPTIVYFLDEPLAEKLHAAGRLDIDTTGLVLMTDDGQWSHRITSPKHHCEKDYLVTLASPIQENVISLFAKGIELHHEDKPTKPAKLEIIDDYHVRLTITEGRYHQVKRMFAAVGNHVVALHRERIGAIKLDDNLEPGEYRELTEDEINSVFIN